MSANLVKHTTIFKVMSTESNGSELLLKHTTEVLNEVWKEVEFGMEVCRVNRSAHLELIQTYVTLFQVLFKPMLILFWYCSYFYKN